MNPYATARQALARFRANTHAKVDMLGLVFDLAMVGIGLPLGLGFIFAANTTGWNASLVTLWNVGMPSLIILVVVMVLIYEHKPRKN